MESLYLSTAVLIVTYIRLAGSDRWGALWGYQRSQQRRPCHGNPLGGVSCKDLEGKNHNEDPLYVHRFQRNEKS